MQNLRPFFSNPEWGRKYLITCYVVLPGVVALYVHEDEIFLEIFAEDDPAGGSSTGLGLQHFKVGLEEVIKKGAFTAVLTSDDSNSEIILLAVLEV